MGNVCVCEPAGVRAFHVQVHVGIKKLRPWHRQ